jgi:hypothetical protein
MKHGGALNIASGGWGGQNAFDWRLVNDTSGFATRWF